MSNELSFEGATGKQEEFVSKYLSPGINVPVKVKEIKQGLSTQKQSPFVEITIENAEGKTCSQQYYLTTTVGEGKKTSAWAISRDAILQLIVAVTGTDEETAKARLVGITTENIAVKLSAFMIGKPFAIVLGGKWVTPEDPQKKSWVKAQFGTGNFATTVAKANELKYDAAKAIKGSPAPGTSNTNSMNDSQNGVKTPTTAANW